MRFTFIYLYISVNEPIDEIKLMIINYIFQTIDTSVDRFGYYVGWGCWAFVPAFFSLQSLYMVKHSPINQFKLASFIFIMILGVIVISLNYWTDRQKQIARATNGKCTIWGKPAKVIKYNEKYKKYIFITILRVSLFCLI